MLISTAFSNCVPQMVDVRKSIMLCNIVGEKLV